MSFEHEKIEQKWQKIWEEEKCFQAQDNSSLPKFYALDMFPYPSGAGLHMGHLASYTPTDILSRFKRAQGFNVLHPMGYDAFGLPAEQFAIQTGVHPEETTSKAINNFRKQLQGLGLSFDWSREISTCSPKFYKWTQFIFTKLFEKGLVYEKEVPVNWCPELKTVLANEEVVDGKSERGGHPVVKLPMKQWMLKITNYADRLLKDLDKLDWPEATKEAQRNWIGRSEGARVFFTVKESQEILEVFTTRSDTLFGVTFIVLAPEHPFLKTINLSQDVQDYIKQSKNKSEKDRQATKEKTGQFTGSFAIHPFTKKEIPIWIADYVLADYGSGAIMAVPAHDERDYEFAEKFKIEITPVIENQTLPFMGEGKHINSDFLDGLSNQKAIEIMNKTLLEKKYGNIEVQYKLRDWLFSRQRYWGEPFPLVRSGEEVQAVDFEELPVILPDVKDYSPSPQGESPLENHKEFLNYKEGLQRITHTMPGSAGSSWYFLRYIDPHNENEAVGFEKQKYWMPVDLYVGGKEHTVGHLLYSRFWQKFLFDIGLTSHDEPFQKLVHQGVILDGDGLRMSKSRGNVVNPDKVRKKYGSDALRLYISFLGPFEKDKPWSEDGLGGIQRFVNRIWKLFENTLIKPQEPSEALLSSLHKTIKKVGEDIEKLHFNTAISSMMILVNEIYKEGTSTSKELMKTLCQLLQPFAPHISEEMWENLGETKRVSLASWPSYNSELVKEDTVTLGVQLNGKTKGTIDLSPEASEEEALKEARNLKSISQALDEKSLKKIIYRKGKILNLIMV